MPDNGLTHLIGDPEAVAVERAIAEIRAGRPVVISADRGAILVSAAETVDDRTLSALKKAAGGEARLVLSPPRLRLLGYDKPEAGVLPLGEKSASAIHEIVSHAGARLNGVAPRAADALDKAALDLVRSILPASRSHHAPAGQSVSPCLAPQHHRSMPTRNYRQNVITKPRIVSRAPVPLEDAADTEFVVFRGGEGMRDQVAVVIGKPDPAEPVHRADAFGLPHGRPVRPASNAIAAISFAAPSSAWRERAAACCSISTRKAAGTASPTRSAPTACSITGL